MSFVELKHNMEVAHRLYELPGKCQQIHGHSMQVRLRVHGNINPGGILENHEGELFEFGEMKRTFRKHLDETYDHRLLLNKVDPWAGPIMMVMRDGEQLKFHEGEPEQIFLPGLVPTDGDPTTENIAKWLALHFFEEFDSEVEVFIQETRTNGVGVYTYERGRIA